MSTNLFIVSGPLAIAVPGPLSQLRASDGPPVAVPSESFFATVLLNDESLHVARENRRFVSFTAPLTPHPETLTTSDLDRLAASGCDFARKFDVEVDAEVLDALDERRRAGTPR